jgi:hypothetical protein
MLLRTVRRPTRRALCGGGRKGVRTLLDTEWAAPKPTAQQKQAALKLAHCMRTHGVPSFPDPAFSSTGGPGDKVPLPVNTSSPAFKQARAACGKGPGHGGG